MNSKHFPQDRDGRTKKNRLRSLGYEVVSSESESDEPEPNYGQPESKRARLMREREGREDPQRLTLTEVYNAPQGIDVEVFSQTKEMADHYGLPEEMMKQLLSAHGSDDQWYVSLLTTTGNRKMTTHISRSRTPFRKVALHNTGLTQSRSTRGSQWALRFCVGPFRTAHAADLFKEEWVPARSAFARMKEGVARAKAIGVDYFFTRRSDGVKLGEMPEHEEE